MDPPGGHQGWRDYRLVPGLSPSAQSLTAVALASLGHPKALDGHRVNLGGHDVSSELGSCISETWLSPTLRVPTKT
jgi:hypothetical protein